MQLIVFTYSLGCVIIRFLVSHNILFHMAMYVFSLKIPGVPDDVRKQFKEMILKEKDLAPAGDA